MKAMECDLSKVTAESIQITELICGINNQKLREAILRLKDPSLEDCVSLGRQFDTAAKVEKANFGDEARAAKTSDYKQGKKDSWDKNKKSNNNNDKPSKCLNCGGKFHPRSECPAKDKKCGKCDKQGHYTSLCYGGYKGLQGQTNKPNNKAAKAEAKATVSVSGQC